MIKGFITAIRTLSIIPISGKDATNMGEAVSFFPAVGLLLGIIIFLTAKFGGFVSSWYYGTAAILVFLDAFLTRGIHLDGVADFSDGFGGGYQQEEVLTIMKDSRIGTFGVLSLVSVILIKFISFAYLLEHRNYIVIIPIYVVSRWVMSELSVRLPYARKEGGTGKPFVENSKLSNRLSAAAMTLLFMLPFAFLGFVLMIVGWVMSYLLGIWFMKRIDGITGDLLGASCEITVSVLLFLSAVFNNYAYGLINFKHIFL